ncbi:ribosomal-protein-alanine acetyltransferase [Janthinobacterium sp. BJB412]|nr:ribosomal-protein-alanine acetyltransferase [Janthinobacterium sp. BJB412]
MIHIATAQDITALLSIENASFAGDRISRRNFRHLLGHGNTLTLLDARVGAPRGYLMLLFRANSSVARLYTIATHPDFLGRGVAAALLRRAELAARARGCDRLRLEIRHDNQASLGLFQSRDYRIFGQYADYYEDGMHAHRLEKPLARGR